VSVDVLALRLGELERGLEGLLSCFESERFPVQESTDAAWSHVLGAFDALRAELVGPIPEDLRESVQDCLRLYAVTAGVLARRREELSAERSKCAEARARLRRRKHAFPSGGSCDVQG